jgi:molecular chaperone GrpE
MSEKEDKKISLEDMVEGVLPKEEASTEEELNKLKSDLLFALAETENLRKRHAKEKDELGKFAVSSALAELTVPFEHLFAALKVNVPETVKDEPFVKSLLEGTLMVQKEFEKVFTKLGLKRIYPEGEKFNPNFHQAVSQVEDMEKDEGTVIAVVSAGFELNGRILRPAMVVVSKK